MSNEHVGWSTIKHFRPEEFACSCCGEHKIVIELVKKVDELRKAYGRPMTINSGYRCMSHSESLRKPTSSHTKGVAADIRVDGSRERFELLALILKMNLFTRIGIANGFIHVDIDLHKDSRVAWVYS